MQLHVIAGVWWIHIPHSDPCVSPTLIQRRLEYSVLRRTRPAYVCMDTDTCFQSGSKSSRLAFESVSTYVGLNQYNMTIYFEPSTYEHVKVRGYAPHLLVRVYS